MLHPAPPLSPLAPLHTFTSQDVGEQVIERGLNSIDAVFDHH